MSKLFSTDWIAPFDFWKLPVNSFPQKVDVAVKEKSEKKKKRKNYFRLEN